MKTGAGGPLDSTRIMGQSQRAGRCTSTWHTQPCRCERVTAGARSANSPQLVSSLMSLQSALLSHRYSIRMHVPSPHLCSSAMHALTLGVTGGGEGKGGGIKRMQVNASATARHSDTRVGQQQRPGRIGLLPTRGWRKREGQLLFSCPGTTGTNRHQFKDRHLTGITHLLPCSGGTVPNPRPAVRAAAIRNFWRRLIVRKIIANAEYITYLFLFSTIIA